MTNRKKPIIANSFSLILAIGAPLLLGGCNIHSVTDKGSFAYTGEKADTSEDLLEAEGQLRIVEGESSQMMDPLAMHMRARKQVDPFDFEKTAQYTKKARPETRQRILRLAEETVNIAEKMMPPKLALQMPGGESKQLSNQQELNKIEPAAGAGGGAEVVDIRMGEHPGKTRVVLDLTGKSGFEHIINNHKKMIVVKLPQSEWMAGESRVIDNHPLFEAYVAKNYDEGGALLALRLKRDARIVMAEQIGPAPDRPYHRIVFDVTAL